MKIECNRNLFLISENEFIGKSRLVINLNKRVMMNHIVSKDRKQHLCRS